MIRNVRLSPSALLAPLDASPDQRRAKGAPDVLLAAAIVLLIGFGLVMVYSAGAADAATRYHDGSFYLRRQGVYAVVAVALMFGVSMIDYHRIYKLTYPVLFVVAALLIVTLTGLGHSGGGAARWIAVGPVHIQPSELAKVSIVAWLAYSLSKKAEAVRDFSVGFLPHLLVAGFFMILCLRQPDFGSAVVLLLLTFALLFLAGAKVGYILGAAILGTGISALLVVSRDYRAARMLAWRNMAEHKSDLAYQPFQSVMSFGSGRVWGQGLGKGYQILFLPEAHTDFISAIVGEELGFVGVLGLVAAYIIVIGRGIRTAYRAPDDYGTYLAYGISILFATQVLINLSVALAILPTKGLTLPFMSYGGSSLLVNAVAAGILLNISRQGPAEAPLAETPLPPSVAEREEAWR